MDKIIPPLNRNSLPAPGSLWAGLNGKLRILAPRLHNRSRNFVLNSNLLGDKILHLDRNFLQMHGLAKQVYARTGGRISYGPFRGMDCNSWPLPSARFNAYLLGSYESSLHAFIEALLKRNYKQMVDIGCADGYYAVGLALRQPGMVHAFDLLPEKRRECARLARHNAVASRVVLYGTCSLEKLRELNLRQGLVFSDCEGAEWDLLDPAQVPQLTESDLLVELHELFRPGVTAVLHARFSSTHDITIVPAADFDPSSHPLLASLPSEQRWLAARDYRPCGMAWAIFIRKSSPLQ